MVRGRRQCLGVVGIATFCLVLFNYWSLNNESSDGQQVMKISDYNPKHAAPATRQANSSTGFLNKLNCTEWFYDKFEDNLNVIENYPRGEADKYMLKIVGNRTKPNNITSLPVLVTGANYKYYDVSQGLLKSIAELLMPKYPGLRVVYYDLGLYPDQLKQLRENCDCEVRAFPFDILPRHVRHLKQYAWKPVIIQKTFLEFGFIWWLDSSVRFLTDDLDGALNYARTRGYLLFTLDNSLGYHTDIQTMQYLGEDSCKFRIFEETIATLALFYFNDVTEIMIDRWAACALNASCIVPPGTPAKLYCHKCMIRKEDGCCHRYDQSVLGIMHRRLDHSKLDYPDKDDPLRSIFTIQRNGGVHFFP